MSVARQKARLDPCGSVQHQGIQDQDTGATFTVKLYSSEKVSDGDEWRHSRIVLLEAVV